MFSFGNDLILFFVFFIPGFISLKVYDLLVPNVVRDFSKSSFEVLGYSALNFAFFSWIIYLIQTDNFYKDHTLLFILSWFCILFVFPVLWPCLIIKIITKSPIRKYVTHPIQESWDFLFGKRESFWTIVHLKDGRKIGGKFDTNSFASSHKSEKQIFLEEVWELNSKGGFVTAIDRSRGIIIFGEEISSIEFFK